MKIEKKYHFYAGHRNKEAGEKCGRPHDTPTMLLVRLSLAL